MINCWTNNVLALIVFRYLKLNSLFVLVVDFAFVAIIARVGI